MGMIVKEHRQKSFVTLSGFWSLRGLEDWVNALTKENS